jgi:ribosomal protein S27AE
VIYEEKRNKKRLETKRIRSRWRFGECPKCEGAMYSNYGDDFSCFNCGYIDYNSNINIRGGNNGEKENYKRNY